MPVNNSQYQQLQTFFNQSDFESKGAIITDLDGTIIHEQNGHYSIPASAALALEKIYKMGRPVILNTLRFPLSVIRTFGKEWYKISNSPIPTVLLNGSQLGYIQLNNNGDFIYKETDAFPLDKNELLEILSVIKKLIDQHFPQLVVFYYPRNWQEGEIIWTPNAAAVQHLQQKYLSASNVFCSNLTELQERLQNTEICMICMLLDIPQDKLMAYQHTKKNNFYTHKGVDKDYGTKKIAEFLGIDLAHSVGAGDSEMDNFLSSVGLAIHVNNPYLKYEGRLPSIKLGSSVELGELLSRLADLQKATI